MDEIKNNAALEAEEQEESLILKFRRPYPFEGQEYTELDLSGLENVTAGTLENIGKIMAKKSPGLNPATIEMEMGYCELLAARVTGKPLEFFQRLPARDAIALKSKIVGFLYGGDGNNGHPPSFGKPASECPSICGQGWTICWPCLWMI